MKTVHPYAAGLDIGKKTVVACIRTPKRHETRTFSMMTRKLLQMADWLQECGLTHVAMESTGVYWKPIYNLLEGFDFELALVHPRDSKNVPGRKTDAGDAQWLCDLHRHGLLRASFVPGRAHRELRELVRYRKSLVEERTREINRLEKVLEGANIKLGAVASTLTGKGVREMLRALAEGETDTERMAEMARRRMRSKREALKRTLEGVVGPHQRFMLREQLDHVEDLRIERVSQEIAQRLGPFEDQLLALMTIPGVGRTLAEVILAEIGFDLSCFPTYRHLASWAKLCPGNNESAGKRRSSAIGKGNRYLRAALVEVAHSAGRKKGSYLHAQYHRLSARRGRKRAAVAVAHSMLVAVYHMLKEGVVYEDLGANYFDERKAQQVVWRMQRRLERLGYDVALTKKAA